jgi:large subunit ribosomal protein L18
MKTEHKKTVGRWRRHMRIRKKLIGTSEKPRLCVYRSSKHIYCQLIDDTFVDKNGHRSGKVIAGCSTLTPFIKKEFGYGGNKNAATAVGSKIAEMAKDNNIETITFDRGGYKYHGRVQALAEAARKGGLKF